jgi:hypothetical protein
MAKCHFKWNASLAHLLAFAAIIAQEDENRFFNRFGHVERRKAVRLMHSRLNARFISRAKMPAGLKFSDVNESPGVELRGKTEKSWLTKEELSRIYFQRVGVRQLACGIFPSFRPAKLQKVLQNSGAELNPCSIKSFRNVIIGAFLFRNRPHNCN